MPALTIVAVAAGRDTARGHRPWLSLAGIWIAVALTVNLAFGRPADPLASALVLVLPLGVTASVVEMELQRGCSIWWSGSVGVLLGLAVIMAFPILYGCVDTVITWVVRASWL